MFKLEYSQTQNTADVACKAQTVQYRQEVQQGFVRRVRDPSFYRYSISYGPFGKRTKRGRKESVMLVRMKGTKGGGHTRVDTVADRRVVDEAYTRKV